MRATLRRASVSKGQAMVGPCSDSIRATRPGWFSRRKARSPVRWDRRFSPGGSRTVGRVWCGSLPARCEAPCKCISAGPAIGCVCGARAGLAVRELRALIEQGLRLITSDRSQKTRRALPVYVTVRDYEMGVSGALSGFGFAPYLERSRFVRHTTSPVREPLPVSRSAVEVRQEVPARSQSQWCK